MKVKKAERYIALTVIAIIAITLFIPATAEGRLKESWSRNYGGEFHDVAHEVLTTEDGGFLLAGYSNSFGQYRRDQVFVVKTNSNGYTEWRREIGGEFTDRAYAAANTEDGGYILAGSTTSYGGRDNQDAYLVKIDSEGEVEWENNFGGDHNEIAYDIIQTSDEGFILVGSTVTFGHRGRDWWIVRTDSEGQKLWSRYYGGDQDETATSVVETSDGNFVVGGHTASYGDPGYGLWTIEIDEDEIDQDKEEEEMTDKEGVSLKEYLFSLDLAEYGEYLEKGPINETLREEFEVEGHDVEDDAELSEEEERWFISKDGKKLFRIEMDYEMDLMNVYLEKPVVWETNIGGFLDDKIHDLILTEDGGFAATGETRSYAQNGTDFWLVKLDPAGREEWNESYGGTYVEVAHSLIQTGEGTYMMAGYETSWGGVQEDVFVVEADQNGEELFRYETDAERTDIAYSIVQVDEKSFAVGGTTRSVGAGGYSFYLIKLGRPTGFLNIWYAAYTAVGVIVIYALWKLFKKYRYKLNF
ncbi:MAG: hypothetical protein ACOCTR_04105 [Candidatus Natronoplasma sp.]